MADYSLIPHPDFPARSVDHVSVGLSRQRDVLDLIYVVEGSTRQFVLPPETKPYRTDELWRTTCFELFLLDRAGGYRELNFSPSTEWAAYRFDSRRTGMAPLELDAPPRILVTDEGPALLVMAQIDLRDLADEAVGLSVIIEETDGTKSYWALAHAPGPPDFHNPDCFIATLPAPSAA